ncbi:MAG: DUF1491 family protein [Rhodobacterales bacterium]|jgi:hypothetical protein|nr:DUF1491 family protein [Pseudomonadota bacterium]MDA1286309.1 DUF1491 family protein [Pseudomonadota bacterium]HBN30903.1 DUF1491 domain-containing protein [Paracoccaceae bacterium]
MVRLTSEFWVQAYLTRLRLNEIPAFVTAKGDANAGSIMVKLNTLDGRARAFQRSYDAEGNRIWVTLAEGPDAEVEASLARQRGFDRDIWIVEVEDRNGRHLLDEPGLSE